MQIYLQSSSRECKGNRHQHIILIHGVIGGERGIENPMTHLLKSSLWTDLGHQLTTFCLRKAVFASVWPINLCLAGTLHSAWGYAVCVL